MEEHNDFIIAKLFMADIVRHYRNEAGFSQRVLAERIGVSKGFISAIEGKRAAPCVDMFIRIAFALNIEPAEMLDALVKKWRESLSLELDKTP